MTRPQFDESFSLFPLSEIIQNTDSNRKVKKLLETFSCTRNIDLQDFLYNKAVTFEKNLRSRTYLYIDNTTQEVAAYFTITISTLHTDNISPEVIELLDGYKNDVASIPCFLIGQLGKSDKFEPRKIGEYILDDVIEIIDQSQKSLGGRFILLDAINKKSVIKFYEANAFFPIEEDSDSESIKMIKPYFELLDEKA
ncbi:MAG TPA: acetyltransferase [Arcobacter sp.]|nr:acetyltransferase [Arcobacter sp.]